MGRLKRGRTRKYLAQMLQISFHAAMPGIIIYSILLGSFVLQGLPQDAVFTPLIYLRLLLWCYLTALFATLLVELRSMTRLGNRGNEYLIGKHFGGFRKQDNLFSSAMDAFSNEYYRMALEEFLEVQKFELTTAETGVLSFFIGRCYQMLGCPANAITCFVKAREDGFSEPFSMLFEARCCVETGEYERSLTLFQQLLDHRPPREFYFLYTDIGFLYLRQQKPDEAIEWFRQSMYRRMNYAVALSGTAIAFLQKGDFRAANDYQVKALMNRMKDGAAFRKYFSETKITMLAQHPDWDPETGRPLPKPETADASDPEQPDEGA